ncbi:MAG: SGNH/GDSL hydrolase family protein [Bacteroidales bacterium]|nr:SGNH/GDSL hydrolase family protein [Bacteroidales bacterium]
MSKAQLISRLLKSPASITEKDLDRLLRPENPEEKITTQELSKVTRRIFDINENSVLNRSDASEGMTGRLNRLSRRRRNRKYIRKIRNSFRADSSNKVILAEGDSWFEFPVFVKDIIDWLKKRKDYAIYSLAYGGDWLSNIMYQGEYIEGLPVHDPDVFLISGGGNDMVSGNRLTTMLVNPVKNPDNLTRITEEYTDFVNQQIQNTGERYDILEGKQYLTAEFTSFINVIRLQYELMFSNIFTKYPNLKIITQGYDYAYPDPRVHFGINVCNWHQPLLNLFTGNGKWLFQSFMLKGITDAELQRKIVRTMIFDFNEMLVKIASKSDYPNLFHIDCRNICTSRHDWYDELHPKSGIFKKIAQQYQKCIDGFTKTKILTPC